LASADIAFEERGLFGTSTCAIESSECRTENFHISHNILFDSYEILETLVEKANVTHAGAKGASEAFLLGDDLPIFQVCYPPQQRRLM
jgi:hypothetical protein